MAWYGGAPWLAGGSADFFVELAYIVTKAHVAVLREDAVGVESGKWGSLLVPVGKKKWQAHKIFL